MTIIHLSDLHIQGPNSRLDVLQPVEGKVLKLNPDVLVVSGDFVDTPDEEALYYIADTLRDLCKKCKPCELIVVPGNHDCRVRGVFAWKQHLALFEKAFPKWSRPRLVGKNRERKIAFFCVDSNTNNPRINFARGRFGAKELSRFRADLAKLGEDSAFQHAFKIAVLHHHPLPIADSDDPHGYFTQDAFLGLEDAGTFMREMQRAGIHLVLHGHKHYPFFARIRLGGGGGRQGRGGELTVLAAGSACKPETIGNSFNLLNFSGKAVTLNLYQRAKVGTFVSEGEPVQLIDYEALREDAYREFFEGGDVGRQGGTEEQRCIMGATEEHHWIINEHGDCERVSEYRDLKILSGKSPVEYLPVKKASLHGTFAGYDVETIGKGHGKPTFQIEGDRKRDGELVGRIKFATPLTDQSLPLSYQESFRIYNAFAMDKQQQRRMSGEDAPEFLVISVKHPVDKMLISVQFPEATPAEKSLAGRKRPFPSIDMNEIRAHVLRKEEDTELPNHVEQHWCEEHLYVSPQTRIAILPVLRPLPNHSYGLAWGLPDALVENDLPPRTEGKAEEIRQALLALPPRDPGGNKLQAVFSSFMAELAQIYRPGSKERMEIGLMVFDAAQNRLRYVAGQFNDRYWDYKMILGQGIAARAHKLNEALLYVRKRTPPRMDFSSSGPPGVAPDEVLLCVPLRFPINVKNGWILGVVTLSSTSAASELLDLYENQEEVARITESFHEDLLRLRILPALNQASELTVYTKILTTDTPSA
ncbi:MAG TPA: metallophosphoesterase [Chthoniobacterales bacterium]|jgi:3',5'-cyclic AMP phosphodiesterase CpdA|nr:metallophosphoesterase [Chthoniobacterales bacterium]